MQQVGGRSVSERRAAGQKLGTHQRSRRRCQMKLYNWQFAPNCRRVRMFVLEKGLERPAIEEVIGDRLLLAPGYIQTWPHAMLPILELRDGTSVGEAMAVCGHCETKHPI